MTRKSAEQAKLDAVSQQLREMFQAAESLPIPDRLMSVIDQLDEDEPVPAPRRATSA